MFIELYRAVYLLLIAQSSTLFHVLVYSVRRRDNICGIPNILSTKDEGELDMRRLTVI